MVPSQKVEAVAKNAESNSEINVTSLFFFKFYLFIYLFIYLHTEQQQPISRPITVILCQSNFLITNFKRKSKKIPSIKIQKKHKKKKKKKKKNNTIIKII